MSKNVENFSYRKSVGLQPRDKMGRFSRNGHHNDENCQLTQSFPFFSRDNNSHIKTALNILENGSFNDLNLNQKNIFYFSMHGIIREQTEYIFHL